VGRHLTTLQKGLLLIAIPVLFQLVFVAALLRMQRQSVQAQYQAIQTQDVIVQSESVLRAMIEALNSSRGRVITDNQVFAEDERRSTENAQDELRRLYQLVAGNAVQIEHVRAIDRRCQELILWLKRIDDLLNQGNRDQAIADIKELYGKRRVDALRAEIAAFVNEERRLDAQRRDDLERGWALHNRFLIAGLFLAVVIALTMLILFYRGISRRMELLADKAQRLGEGKPLPPPLEGTDEIAQLDRRFHDMAKMLDERTRENELFVYSASRDLRSPLLNLRGYLDDLRQALKRMQTTTSTPPGDAGSSAVGMLDEVPKSINAIEATATRMGTIIDSLLRLARAGRIEYQWQAVDVGLIVRRIIASQDLAISDRNVKVTLDSLPPAWGDPSAIEQLFAALVSNALNYLDPERRGRIEIGALPASDGKTSKQHVYYVRDNGMGIPKDMQSKLFLAFQRFHPDFASGEGIGLAVARRIVSRHGGNIWVDSVLGRGTTFYLSLPSADEPPGSLSDSDAKPAVRRIPEESAASA
jgi:signal transduction histidine kinase